MSNLTSEELKLYENYELATPGQSLTNSPDQKYASAVKAPLGKVIII